MIFPFITFMTNTPLWGKTLLKSEKNILQISHLIFWMLQAAKYLIYDLTFTFSFFFIRSKLNWTLFHLSGIFGCKRNDGQGWNFRLKYLDERGSSKARGYRQVGEAVEGGQKGKLDGKLAGARISKGRKMPHVNVIYILAKHWFTNICPSVAFPIVNIQ